MTGAPRRHCDNTYKNVTNTAWPQPYKSLPHRIWKEKEIPNVTQRVQQQLKELGDVLLKWSAWVHLSGTEGNRDATLQWDKVGSPEQEDLWCQQGMNLTLEDK